MRNSDSGDRQRDRRCEHHSSISAEDVDLPAGASLTFSTTSTAAGLTLNADGSYSFDASSYDSLKAGEEQVITILWS
ncbi:VCBS domain-containing protein [Vibrio vulnificus]|uniref:VCBS domain-containing protein n=1 Tax=Vibrio vulnificus TaxID=672 RepID=UPI0012ADD344|nr:VCBS domain-containing protein [Vibrio vulnificus]